MIEALILGFVQGLTEFLPISSSAHLRILGEFLPAPQDPGAAFTAITQLGTETAVVVFFWRDIVRIVSHWFGSFAGRVPRNDPDARMGWLIIVGSIPIVVLGLLFQDEIETTFRSLWIVADDAHRLRHHPGLADWAGAKRRKLDELTVPHGIFFGFAQSLALIPGVSRSGGTITDRAVPRLRARGRGALRVPARDPRRLRQRAVPAVQELRRARRSTAPSRRRRPRSSRSSSAIVVIAFFMSYISKHSFLPFVIYRIVLGGILFALLGTGVLQATDCGSTAAAAPSPVRPARLVAAGPVGAVAAATQVALELLRDRLAARLGGVDRVARLLELRDVARHVLVVGRERVDARLPGLGLRLEVAAGDRQPGELLEPCRAARASPSATARCARSAAPRPRSRRSGCRRARRGRR